jgi:hypothetical protein
VSIVEVVIKFTGTCIAARPLQELFHNLACGPMPAVPCALVGAHHLHAESEESHEMDIFGWYISSRLAIESIKSLSLRTQAQARTLDDDAWAQKQRSSWGEAVPMTAPTVDCEETGSGAVDEVKKPRKGRRKDLALLREHSRKYLLELRVVFDEQDYITEWSTKVLAAERYQAGDANG